MNEELVKKKADFIKNAQFWMNANQARINYAEQVSPSDAEYSLTKMLSAQANRENDLMRRAIALIEDLENACNNSYNKGMDAGAILTALNV